MTGPGRRRATSGKARADRGRRARPKAPASSPTSGPILRFLDRLSLGTIFHAGAVVALLIGLGLVFLVPDLDASTTGTVVGHRDATRGCTADIDFVVDGVHYESLAGSSGRYCPGNEGFAVGDAVLVRYDPADPTSNDLRENAVVTGLVVVAVGLALAAVGVTVDLRTRRRRGSSPG